MSPAPRGRHGDAGLSDRKEPTNLSATLYDALERAVKALQAHPELAPSITVSMTDDGLWVTPWIRGAPMKALLTWHDAMTDVERETESSGVEGGDSYTKVTVRGLLDDVPVIAQTVTFQALSTANKISIADLRKAASEEEEF